MRHSRAALVLVFHRLSADAGQRSERPALAPTIAQADKTLKAAGCGEKALSSTHMQQIAGYDQGMLGEIEMLITKTEEISRTASRTVHCGSQAVTVPMAVCR